jgi:hypothetical protein
MKGSEETAFLASCEVLAGNMVSVCVFVKSTFVLSFVFKETVTTEFFGWGLFRLK